MRQIFALAALSLTLAACGEFRENASASIVEGVTGTALGPKPYAPADFVVRSRGADAPFMAVGVSAPERKVKPRTQAQAAALQSELSAAAQAQQAAGAATAAEGQRVSSNPPRPPKVE